MVRYRRYLFKRAAADAPQLRATFGPAGALPIGAANGKNRRNLAVHHGFREGRLATLLRPPYGPRAMSEMGDNCRRPQRAGSRAFTVDFPCWLRSPLAGD